MPVAPRIRRRDPERRAHAGRQVSGRAFVAFRDATRRQSCGRSRAPRRASSPRRSTKSSWATCIQAGLGQNPARQAALGGGLDPRVAAMTINKVCGSGLKAVALAAQGVMLGESEIVVAGGMESMSNCPYLLPGARNGYRIGNAELVDSMVHDGLWDVYDNFHMGMAAELVAEKYKISRQEQDQFALESHQQRRRGHELLLHRIADRAQSKCRRRRAIPSSSGATNRRAPMLRSKRSPSCAAHSRRTAPSPRATRRAPTTALPLSS